MDNGVAGTSIPRRHQALHLDIPESTPTSGVTTARSRARSISPALPSLRISTTPSVSLPAIPLSAGVSNQNRAPREPRNLLAHLLSRLGARPQAPSIFDELRTDSTRNDSHRLGAVVKTVRSAVGFKSGKELSVPNGGERFGEEDGSLEAEQGFSTDVTYEYMVQLRDILILSEKQGWEILDTTNVDETVSSQRESSSLRRLRRNSAQLGPRSRSPSPNGSSQSPRLLLDCINILASVVCEDCRFKMSNARLRRPPYGLQATCLDIAQILIKAHCHDAKILSLIGFAIIPAFASFDPVLHTKLLAFFEDGILRGMLEELQTYQGMKSPHPKDPILDNPTESKTPIVAIQVDEAADDPQVSGRQGWLQWSSTTSAVTSTCLSAVAPSQPLAVYHLSSLIPPLLAAIFESIDPFEDSVKDIPRLHRFHTLLHTIVSMKRDAYLDVLEVVAYHGAPTRHRALAVLATFWPKALGHVVIGKALPIIGYSDTLSTHTSSILRLAQVERDHPYAHEFMPWRFSSGDFSSLVYDVLCSCCHSCSSPIVGFGLLCPFCLVCVHVNCYNSPDGTFHGHYLPSSGTSPQPYFLSFSNILSSRKDCKPQITRKAEHSFRLANLFSLALCSICHKPLWGYIMQGLKCTRCHQFVHSSCMATGLTGFPRCDENSSSCDNAIEWSVLRQTFAEHYRQILFPEDVLIKKNYEEISIYYSVLWAQLRILDNGVGYRSIIVNQKNPKTPPAKENFVDEFELQYFVKLYEAYLSSGRLAMSAALQEYLNFNNIAGSHDHSILFDLSLLSSVTSYIKLPVSSQSTPVPTSSNLLQVADQEVGGLMDDSFHPYELVMLSHMRNALRHEYQVHLDDAARYMLSQIHHVGFFNCVDPSNELFDCSASSDVLCSFPLPSGLDLSTSVETLVVAIDACLRDIDIAVNEYGFLLLVRRFAPTGAASEYALSRLTKIVLSWIFAEDDRLVIIARDHVAHNLSLPGVRTASELAAWPFSSTNRYNPKPAVNSGGEYVLCRKQLLTRHAMPWLFTVHGLDSTLYANFLYDYCLDMAEASQDVASSLSLSNVQAKVDQDSKLVSGEIILRSIIKLAQANVIFSSFESILIRWFDFVTLPGLSLRALSFKSLPRLFNHEAVPTRRTSTVNNATLIPPDIVQIDAWQVFINAASQSIDGFERSMLWLGVMAHSAVEIPIQTLKQLFTLAQDFHAPLATTVSLLESTLVSTWPKAFGIEGLDIAIVEINVIWADDLLFQMRSDDDIDRILDFLRFSLVTSLLVYGCERQAILSLGLIGAESLRYMPQRRRTASRTSAPLTALNIDPQLITILSRYVAEGPESVCVIAAKFLNILVSESALLEPHEIDQFILTNGDPLAQCAWRFYDIELEEISNIRPSFLLRLLVVDPQPLDTLLRSFLQPTGKWQTRFQAVIRLFRILLDVNSPYFGVQDRQWKTSVTDVINHFFRSLWTDDREEIRLAVDTWARTLLPPHLRAISACWNEYMSKAPVADRARLASFLVQLHPHFPTWQVISWETIVESLLDDDFVQSNGAVEDGYAAAAHLSVYGYPSSATEESKVSTQDDPEVVPLRISLVILSLQLLADGAMVDLVSLLKIKLILAKVLGFAAASLQPTANGQTFHVRFEELNKIPGVTYACINPLMRVLDAPHTLTFSPSSMGVIWNESPVSGLMGDVFVDIVAKLWDNVAIVRGLPYPILRGLLESMVLIIVKHELNSPSLKHLGELMCRAVKTVTDLINMDTSYDIHHLCLTVILAFMQAYPVLSLKILGHQVLVLTRLAASLQFNMEDPLVAQAREFLKTAFVQYEVSGLFWLLSKQGRMSDDLFMMIGHAVNDGTSHTRAHGELLRDSIVRDTLSKVAASTNDSAIPDVLHNLERYVSLCHHQSYSASLIQHIGLRLTAIARQTADVAAQSNNRIGSILDPNPLLLMAATIAQYNQSESIDLLLHTETLLRTALVRFDVQLSTLNRLLGVISSIYRGSKTVDLNGAEIPANHIAMGILDILSDALKGKVRALSSTMTAMLEVSLHNDQSPYFPTAMVLRVCSDAVPYLSNPGYRETYDQVEFAASLAVVKLALHASTHVDTFLTQSLVESRSSIPVRVWNLLALGCLKSPKHNEAQKMLVLLPHFMVAYVSLLRVSMPGVLNDSAAPSVNHAFASVKLWMLIARKSYMRDAIDDMVGNSRTDNAERMVWNELWPPFERLLAQSSSDGLNAEKPPLLTFIWGCVSDLIFFVRQAGSVVALDTSSHTSILNQLRVSSRGEVAGGKFARAQRSISEPPMELSFEELVSQVSSDVFTAEKLQFVEAYRHRREYQRKDT